MISCEYVDLDGKKQFCDLDAVVDIVRGQSQKKSGWVALIVLCLTPHLISLSNLEILHQALGVTRRMR